MICILWFIHNVLLFSLGVRNLRFNGSMHSFFDENIISTLKIPRKDNAPGFTFLFGVSF